MQIVLRNSGNTAAVYKLSATSPNDKLNFHGERHHLLLPPGANESSYAQIKLVNRNWVGRKRTLPFEIQMTHENGSTLTAPGNITTVPVIPWYWVAAMVGIICGGAWWMFLA